MSQVNSAVLGVPVVPGVICALLKDNGTPAVRVRFRVNIVRPAELVLLNVVVMQQLFVELMHERNVIFGEEGPVLRGFTCKVHPRNATAVTFYMPLAILILPSICDRYR